MVGPRDRVVVDELEPELCPPLRQVGRLAEIARRPCDGRRSDRTVRGRIDIVVALARLESLTGVELP